ncbi:permease prefix domain 1-containing protein [Peribacillus butanolivorans]|uniref:permease prefix domain 1-containing protein n=1 Tax=Peribacillus butanolivorans TaxID=421767 RepID=UPI002E1AF66C|nr:permease prefix domain 1-containing protein [Peribacillus butanolivorans]
MIEKLNAHVHSIFAPYQNAKTAKELEEELLQNLIEKYNDYKQKGSSEQEAYRLTVDSIGEVSELLEAFNLQYSELEQAINMDYSRQRLLDSDFRSVSVHDGKFNSCDLTLLISAIPT